MQLCDSHVHFFSHDFFAAMVRQKDAHADVDRVLADLAARTGIALPEREVGKHLQLWLAELDRHGVQRAVVFASLPEEVTAVAEALSLAKSRLTGFFMINPLAEGCTPRVHKCHELGFRGAMLLPALHHYHVCDPGLSLFWQAVSECRLHVFVHFGILQVKLRDALGLSRVYDSCFANPLDLHSVANRFLNLHFIIPHFGCGFWRETLMLGAQCDNVLVDTSSSNNWMATQPFDLSLAGVFHRAKTVFGAERMLFGTDSGAFPRGWRKDIFLAQQEAMYEAKFSTTEMEMVFGGNASRLQ
jgi:predicted TIM-barrel fold metal-dependent hydrolase